MTTAIQTTPVNSTSTVATPAQQPAVKLGRPMIDTLRYLASIPAGCVHKDIASATGRDKGNMLRPLTAGGLVTTSRYTGANGGHVFTITPDGRAALASYDAAQLAAKTPHAPVQPVASTALATPAPAQQTAVQTAPTPTPVAKPATPSKGKDKPAKGKSSDAVKPATPTKGKGK
jgi:hypothetical protein